MDLRLTPAFAVASLLTAVIIIWLAIDATQQTFAPNAIFNVTAIAAGLTWLYVASGRRREREAVRQVRDDADTAIRQLRSH